MKNKSKETNFNSIIPILTIIFVIFKLTSIINWSWWWVFSPLLIPLTVVVIVWIICLVLAIIEILIKKARGK